MQSFISYSGYGYSKRLCENTTHWFINKFFPRHKLDVEILHRGLKREGVLGYCDVAGETYRPRSFLIELDTYLDKKTYVRVLLHELYHLKQWVDGELKLKASKKYFKGECVEDLQYWEQPHEIFAYWNEKLLYNEYVLERSGK